MSKPELPKFIVVLLFVMGMSYIGFLNNGEYTCGIDDANIYFVYMRNLAHGHGFVYNVGGEHVEGFTSMLWCLWGAALYLFTDTPEPLLLAGNVLFVSYCLWRLVCFVDGYFAERRILSPNTLFLFFCLFLFPGYFEWTVLSLLDTGLWSGLLILAVLNLFRWYGNETPAKLNRQLAWLLVLLMLTRPESMVFVPFMAAVRFGQAVLRFGGLRCLGMALLPGAAALAAGMLLIGFRLWYFGYPFPNTYYAKVSQDTAYNLAQGWLYVRHVADEYIPLMYAIPFVLLAAVVPLRKSGPWQIIGITAGIFLLTVWLPLYSGGDHFGLARVIQPTLPILYAGTALAVRARMPLHGFYTQAKNILLLLFCGLTAFKYGTAENTYRYGTGNIRSEFEIAFYGRGLGKDFSAFFSGLPQTPSQAVLVAGGFAYAYSGETVDVLGLNNVAMAHADKVKQRGVLKNHASFNKDVFFEQRPDMVWLTGPHFLVPEELGQARPPEDIPAYRDSWTNRVFQGLAYDARFRQTYSPVRIFKQGESRWMLAHVSNGFIPKLSRAPFRCEVVSPAR